MPACDNPKCTKSEEELEGVALKQCSECKQAAYCGKECQLQAWAGHKTACKRMRASASVALVAEEGAWNESFVLSPGDEIRAVMENHNIPLKDRIVLRVLDDIDMDSRHATAFAGSIDIAECVQLAIDRFIQTGDKGAVVFNIKDAFYEGPNTHRPMWFRRTDFARSGEPRLITQVSRYNPAERAVLLFVLPIGNLEGMYVWSLEPAFEPEPPVRTAIAKVMRAWARR